MKYGKKVKKVSITTNITEYKSLEKYLESMARKGFILSDIEDEVFIFERKASTQLDFMIRPICNESGYNNTNEASVKEHIKVYKYNGWDFCVSNDIYIIFYKQRNMLTISIPVYIDSKQEYKNIRKVFCENECKKIIGVIFSILLAIVPFFDFTYKKLFSNLAVIVVMIPFFLTLGVIIRYMPAVIWFISNRINLIFGKKLSFPRNIVIQTRMKLIRIYSAVFIIVAIFFISGLGDKLFNTLGANNQEVVLNLSDFGETINPVSKWTDNKTSITVPVNVKYYEYVGGRKKGIENKKINTTYIRAINKEVADYIFEGNIKESSKGINKYEEEVRGWNVDRGYYLSEHKSKIIIQKDNIIYILEGSFDFSNKEIVEICEEKLGV